MRQYAGLSRCSVQASSLCGGFKQFRKAVDIGHTCVTNDEITKAALTPCLHIKRQFLRRQSVLAQAGWQFQLLKYEYRNVMLPHIIDQLCPGRLVKIGHPASEQREF